MCLGGAKTNFNGFLSCGDRCRNWESNLLERIVLKIVDNIQFADFLAVDRDSSVSVSTGIDPECDDQLVGCFGVDLHLEFEEPTWVRGSESFTVGFAVIALFACELMIAFGLHFTDTHDIDGTALEILDPGFVGAEFLFDLSH